METVIDQLRIKADKCENSSEGRARKGAYVDCLLMIKNILHKKQCKDNQ